MITACFNVRRKHSEQTYLSVKVKSFEDRWNAETAILTAWYMARDPCSDVVHILLYIGKTKTLPRRIHLLSTIVASNEISILMQLPSFWLSYKLHALPTPLWLRTASKSQFGLQGTYQTCKAQEDLVKYKRRSKRIVW